MSVEPPSAHDALERLAQGLRAYVLVGLVAALAAFAGLTTVPTLDRDEGRYAQATAQMLETGDFVRIRYLDAERNKKPAGAHWLQALSVATFSTVEAREIWAYRLPSLVGAVIAALATFWGGIALVGRRAAFFGAILFAPSVLIAAEGQIAKTDALLCAACALALAALARLRLRPAGAPGRRDALLLWAAVAAGALIKGPVAPMAVALAIGALILWERRASWLTPMLWWPGPLLAAAIALPWWVAIGVLTDGRFYTDAFLGDVGDKISAGGEHPWRPPGLHTLLLPLLIFPATIGLPAAAWLSWSATRANRDEERFAGVRVLLAWAAPTFLVFEIASAKLVHYTLPTYPAIALLAGAGLLAAGPAWRRWSGLALFAVAGVALVALATALARYGADPASPVQVFAVGLFTLAVALAALAWRRGPATMAAAGVALALVFAWGVRGSVLPQADGLSVSHAAAQALGEAAPQDSRIFLIGYAEPSLVFAAGARARPGDAVTAGAEAVSGDLAVVEARQRTQFEAALRTRGLRFAPMGAPAAGVHYNNSGRPVALQTGRITAIQ